MTAKLRVLLSLIEAHSYECVYIGSYATAASRFAMPDTGLLSLEELASHAKNIARAVRVPVIADAEGFENAVPAFEEAGVAAIHIEDHTGAGKHTDQPQTLKSPDRVCEIIRAAVAARKNPNFVIAARSDAFWVHRDLDDCIARLQRYAEAFAALRAALAARELASDTAPLEDFLGYTDAPGRSR